MHITFASSLTAMALAAFSAGTTAFAPPRYPTASHRMRQRLYFTSDPANGEVVTATEDVVVTPPIIRLTWESSVEQQIRRAVHERMRDNELSGSGHKKPYMVAVIGIPGSGKSTSTSILNGMLSDLGSLHMPFDGYHHAKDVLNTFPDPEDALYRRGAPDTFDITALHTDLERIRYGSEQEITIPDFDHAVADPQPDAHVFNREEHNVVLVEGLYLLHDKDGWENLKNFFDLSIFVNADVDVCVERLKERNKCIPGYTPEEIERRCHIVDRANAITVMQSASRASLVVQSAAMMKQPELI